ncbi:MAG TPA: GlsB/YeaQ/YmgE family stress response membrane protein [Hyphomicrobiales bacterium]|nr:GlsB/YeaQ/YmgE family stress response membrane protein [Hyphomicrobiales bacterium]
MVISAEALLVIVLVGLTAGWLAGQIVRRAGSGLAGFGLVGDLVIGVGGALLGGWLLPQLGLSLGAGLVAAIIHATIGAVALLLAVGLVRGRGGWRRNGLDW